ncbi:MAG: helix-turn-helix transcriptional regulator, partial [Coprobacillus sp.]
MNIEIANKLLQLRKEKGLSQEQLAAELGISRQAISKWERAEASPDTDNLIELAKLYGVSLDDLLLHEPDSKETNEVDETEETIEDKIKGKFKDKFKDTKNEYVHVGLDGIHVKEKDGDEVHVTWHGIHVEEKGGDQVHIGNDGVFVNGEKYEKEDWYDLHHYQNSHYFPFGMLIGIGVLIYSIVTSNW